MGQFEIDMLPHYNAAVQRFELVDMETEAIATHYLYRMDEIWKHYGYVRAALPKFQLDFESDPEVLSLTWLRRMPDWSSTTFKEKKE